MRLHVSADIPLSEPNASSASSPGSLSTSAPTTTPPTPPASATRASPASTSAISSALDLNVPLLDVLDADSGELEALHDIFFENDWLKDEYLEGGGNDALYISELVIDPAYEGRNIDLALVRRLCDTLAQGCTVAILPYASQRDIDHWTPLGFEVTPPGGAGGYLHLLLGTRRARVDDPDQPGVFKVLPNPSPEAAERHH
ncbi:hypothetical protein [Polyangium sorediatum]|uniref:N-acetyltransferase domain-containing protein n=1 Tax=Polyangium sorediatum TaxID=889274 RepID=A0ABT6P3J0_9BACT|nr:hypothetical protein [Polyangium sorediatum]MDI1435175.1 hypothetical protein [Polyangium sorediatum]